MVLILSGSHGFQLKINSAITVEVHISCKASKNQQISVARYCHGADHLHRRTGYNFGPEYVSR